MEVGKDGTILQHRNLDIETVKVDKNGSVSVEWRWNIYDDLETARINNVNAACSNRIQGVFTSKEEAINIAKKHFDEQKNREIAELEAKLAELKNS